MWKTRFEVSNSSSTGVMQSYHHRRSSYPSTDRNQQVQPLPTVPRVREGSPSAIIRVTPPSSAPQLESLDEEEDEDISSSIISDNEQLNQFSSIPRRRHSHQLTRKRHIALPTIVESNDSDIMIENLSSNSDKSMIDDDDDEFVGDRSNKSVMIIKAQQPLVASNTNYNQIMNINMGTKERTLTSDGCNEITSFTLDKRIVELIQQRYERQNRSISSSSDTDTSKTLPPTTFKDISAFFERKVSAAAAAAVLEPKKIVRAKRLLQFREHVPENHRVQQPKEEISWSTEEECTVFQHQIKRIKKSHRSDILLLKSRMTSGGDSSIEYDINSDTIVQEEKFANLHKAMPCMPAAKTLSKRWFIFLAFLSALFVYFYISYKTSIDNVSLPRNLIEYFQRLYFVFFPLQAKQQAHAMHHNKSVIYRYAQFIQVHLFSIFDLFFKCIGEMFFRVDKFEYRNKLAYIATSTSESALDWVMHWFDTVNDSVVSKLM